MSNLFAHAKSKICICILLASCNAIPIIPGPTPSILNFGNPPSLQVQIVPRDLDCSLITDVRRGLSWRNLQIGRTTYEEMIEFLGPANVYWDTRLGNLVFEEIGPPQDKDWFRLGACFAGNILSALEIYTGDLPRSLDELIVEYGEPDLVTWGTGYFTRSLVWGEKGMLAVVDVATEQRDNILLFPPIRLENFQESWLVLALPKEGTEFIEPEYNIDTVPLPRKLEVEDPWGFNDE